MHIKNRDLSRINNSVVPMKNPSSLKVVLAKLLTLSFLLVLLSNTQTSYGVSSSGAFQFQIPIIIPQGRNGVQPNLSLSFSSSGGNEWCARWGSA